MLLLRTVASRYLIAFATCCSLLSVGALWWMDILAAVHRTPLAVQPVASYSNTIQLAAELSKLPRRRINVAVASDFGFHYDVYLTLVGTMQRAMNGAGSFSVYSPLPLGFDFQTVVDKFGLYHGPPIQTFDALLSDLETSSVDLILIGTCEVDLRNRNEALLRAWNARDAAHKFKLICFVHNPDDNAWQEVIPDWSRRDSIRLVATSEHVVKTFRRLFDERAGSFDPNLNSAGYEHIPIDVFVPILDMPDMPELPPTRMLSNAVIQGSLNPGRRHYDVVFNDLTEALRKDPRSWGYHPLGDEQNYVPDESSPYPPFRLNLIGLGWMEVPAPLKEVVHIHSNVNYTQFYELMGGMDVCIPAFNPSGGYFTIQSSSTAAMCLQTNTPILVTRRIRDAYTHLDDDRVVITRPAVLGELHAIQALRTGNVAGLLPSDPSGSGIYIGAHPGIREAIDKLMSSGWVRSKEGFEAVKREIFAQNEVLGHRLLLDL